MIGVKDEKEGFTWGKNKKIIFEGAPQTLRTVIVINKEINKERKGR